MSKIKVDTIESRNGTLTVGASGDTVNYTAGSIPNASLENSAITINGSSVSLGGSVDVGGAIDWQTTAKTTAFTAVAGEGYFVDTTNAAITATLPASPSAGDQVAFKDYAESFATNNLTIARNGENIQGNANDSLILTNRASVVLVYVDATKGWLYTNESNVGDLEKPTFVAATGGTITTDGDFKVHTFTSSGTFTITDAGNPIGSNSVNYLIQAGGGSGGCFDHSGGGGAGGLRHNFPSPATGGTPVTTQSYPITVGAGGAGVSPSSGGNNGSTSSAFGITSAGGGKGQISTTNGGPGGCGGGGGGSDGNSTGGSGNTPNVSPPQGKDGGNGKGNNGANNNAGGGGGGTAVQGTDHPGSPTTNVGALPGGDGTPVSITGSATFYGGGGASCGHSGPTNTNPSGGGQGGGGGSGSPGIAGTANTGGGGGAGTFGSSSGAGGSGVVIIRYKFQ